MRTFKVIILFITMLLNAGCATGKLITRRDYIKMSDDEIRSVFLKHTPLGSTKEQVATFIRYTLKKKYMINNRPYYLLPYSLEKDDFSYEVHLATYNYFIICAYNIYALWIFNKDGILREIQVSRWGDGI